MTKMPAFHPPLMALPKPGTPSPRLDPAPRRPRRPRHSRSTPQLTPLQLRIARAIHSEELGVALSLLRDNPYVKLPDALAQKLAAKLRVRGLTHRANQIISRLVDSQPSALQLLSVDQRTVPVEQYQAAQLATRVATLADAARPDEAFLLVETAPISHVDVRVLESLVAAAGAAGQISRAYAVLDRYFPRFDLQPTATAYAHFVDACGRVGNVTRAASALDATHFSDLSLSDRLQIFERIVDSCVRCGEQEHAERIVSRMRRDKIPRTAHVYSSLLSGSARSQPLQKSLSILSYMRADGLSPQKVETFNALILGCARSARLRDALRIYESICNSDSISPDMATYSGLLSCCARAGDPDKAFEILEQMQNEGGINPNAKMYNWVVAACARVGDVDRAFELSHRMKAEGIRLNVVTNNNLLEACCNAGQLERAFVLVNDMIQHQGVSPNSHTYNTLIRGCGRWGQLDAALRLLTSMRTAGVSPTVITYSVAIDACARSGGAVALDKAFELLHEMQASGVDPNLVTYNSLIHACARTRRADLAFSVLERIRAAKIIPDIVTLCSLIDACGRAGEIEKAFEVLRSMPEEFPSLQPNVPVYNALIHGCFKANDMKQMNSAYEDMKKRHLRLNVVTFSTLISAYAANGDIDSALDILGEMKTNGLSPNRITFTSLIAGYGHRGQVDQAMDMLTEAKRTCGEPDEELYTAAIVAAIGGGRVETALKLANQMTRAGYFVPTVLNRMMRKVGDVERTGFELRNMLSAMEALNIRPQREALEALVTAYAREADVANAFEVLPDMIRLGYPPNLQTYKKLIQGCSLSGTEADIHRALSLFHKLRSKVKHGDIALRSHHWLDLYEATIRAVDKLERSDCEADMRLELLRSMARDCGLEAAKCLADRVCPQLSNQI